MPRLWEKHYPKGVRWDAQIPTGTLPGLIAQSWKAATYQAPKPAPLKVVPTQTLQQRGVVSPGGDLQDPEGSKAHPVLRAASSQIGKPYVFGSGPSTESFDCSDLIQWSYGQVGVSLPRTTFDQIKAGRAVDPKKEQLKPGDLVFPSTHHVVMYVGDADTPGGSRGASRGCCSTSG